MLVLDVAATLAGGVLAGCGGSNTSSIEKSVRVEARKEQAKKGIEEGQAEAKMAEEEAKKQIEEATE